MFILFPALCAATSVHVQLQAGNWQQPPFLLQVIESVSLEYNKYEFIQSAQSLLQLKPLDLYAQLFHGQNSVIQKYLRSVESVEMAKLALANSVYTPVIQAHYHYYNHSVLPQLKVQGDPCPVWVDLDGPKCTFDDFKVASRVGIARYSVSYRPKLLSYDSVYSINPDATLVVLYADVTDKEFYGFFTQLIDLAKKGEIAIALRYRPSAASASIVSISGYGVELAVKNTEYKVSDDRDIADKESSDSLTDDNFSLFNETEAIVKTLSKDEIESIS
jgi:UDP-glucose:glycoprotein glucosyltransferase